MPDAKSIASIREFMLLCYEAQECLKLIMEGHAPDTVLAGKGYMAWDTKIPGLSKVNVFSLAPADLYQSIKDHQWGGYANNWTGFRSVPEKDATAILTKKPPAATLPGGTTLEVAGYEKQSTDRYYDASEPSLNLEFKYCSSELSFLDVKGVMIGRPKETFCINLHVKQVAKSRQTY